MLDDDEWYIAVIGALFIGVCIIFLVMTPTRNTDSKLERILTVEKSKQGEVQIYVNAGMTNHERMQYLRIVKDAVETISSQTEAGLSSEQGLAGKVCDCRK